MHGSSRHSPARRPAPAPAARRTADGAADSERLLALLEPAAKAAGMDLESVRVTSAGRRRLLRIVVDSDGGVSLDDIALVSRELSAELDAAGAMGEQPYTLEVSSPGVDRPLTEPKHWRRATGRLVTVPLLAPEAAEAPPAALTGRVKGASQDGVTLDIEGKTRQFGYRELGPGRVQIEFAPIGAAGDADDEDADDEDADEEGPDGY